MAGRPSKRGTKSRASKRLSTPVVWSGPGGRLPAVRVAPPALHFRLPKPLRRKMEEGATFEGRVLRQLALGRRKIAEESFGEVQKGWWDQIPQKLAEERLRGAFGNEPVAEAAGKWSGYVTVRGVKTPTHWTPEQRRAWADFESEIGDSIVAAEQTYRGKLAERVRAERTEVRAKVAAERAAERAKVVAKRAAIAEQRAAAQAEVDRHARLKGRFPGSRAERDAPSGLAALAEMERERAAAVERERREREVRLAEMERAIERAAETRPMLSLDDVDRRARLRERVPKKVGP